MQTRTANYNNALGLSSKNALIPPAETNTKLDEVTMRKLKSAVDWVVTQRNRDWGWGQDTAHTILALALANSTWFSESHLEAQLMTKQFEMELVLRLWK